MSMLLSLHRIAKKYQQQRVLNDVSLSVNTGEIVGLLGESGSGKSTLLRIAAGLIDADEGEVRLDNQPLPLASDQLIPGHPDIKIVHQEYQLSLPLTVRENINYALRYYEKAYRDERVEELIQLCRLQEVINRPAKLLSGGEKQRTAIARALAEEARVLLLDEPFAHLDFPNRRRLTQTVRELAEQTGVACIFVTHDATDALSLSHQMGILRHGQLLQTGTPQAIYQQPANQYVATLTGEVNLIEISTFGRLFGEITGKNAFENVVMIRPENFLIHQKQQLHTHKAKVIESVFEGSRYRVYLEIESELIMAYYPHFLPKHQIVFVGVSNL